MADGQPVDAAATHGSHVQASQADTPRYCVGCGYNLHALPRGGCPECGRAFDPADPQSTSATRVAPYLRVAGWLTAFCWGYPLLFSVVFYGNWLIAWAVLGHRPVLYIDDPASISVANNVFNYLCIAAIVLLPVVLFAGLFLSTLYAILRKWSIPLIVSQCIGYIWWWMLAIALLRGDPIGVMAWFMD